MASSRARQVFAPHGWPRAPGGGLRWAQAWHQTPFGRYALQWEADDGKITVTAAIPPNAAAKICLEPGAKLLETDGLTFAEQNGMPYRPSGLRPVSGQLYDGAVIESKRSFMVQ